MRSDTKLNAAVANPPNAESAAGNQVPVEATLPSVMFIPYENI
jgi:hypothetical protein